jgi:hypothetical protein
VSEKKLVGQDDSTPDLRAKVTGRSKYAEDFRAFDHILTALEAGRPTQHPLTAHV